MSHRTSISFAQALYLNNEGVDALQRGHKYEAIDLMNHSIKMIRKELSSPSQVASPKTVSLAESLLPKVPLDVDIVEIPCTFTSPEAETTAVFKRALKLSPFLPTFLDDQSVSLMAAVVIFNLALAHHVQQQGPTGFLIDQNISSEKAVALYEMALKLIENEVAFSLQTERVAMFVNLASMNNLLHLHVSYGSHGLVRTTLNRLSFFLRKYNTCLHLTEIELQEILLNMFFLQSSSKAAAAA